MRYIMYNLSIQKKYCKPTVRENLAEYGISHLTDLDLVMLLLGSGTRNIPVQKLAKEVLELLRSYNPEDWLVELNKKNGIGMGKASIICAAMEFGRRFYSHNGKKIKSPEDIIPLVHAYTLQQQEHFICITLNGCQEVINMRVVSVGTINRTLIHPREVFAEAIKERASGIIVCHNHPSGIVEPSDNDIIITDRLIQAGDVLGIKLLDHIIIASTGFFSFLEQDLIPELNK